MITKCCNRATLITLEGQQVFCVFRSRYVLEQSDHAESAISTQYHSEKEWQVIKAKRKVNAEAQLGIELKWIDIEPIEVGFASI